MALRTRRGLLGSAEANKFMTGGTPTQPSSCILRDRMVVGSATLVAKFSGGSEPFSAVACSCARDRVSDFVEEDLVDVVVFGQDAQVARHCDASLGVIAGAKTSFRVVKSKTPGVVEVEGNECLRPHSHSRKFRHDPRLIREG